MSTYPIKDIFRLESGTTALVCAGVTKLGYAIGRTAKLSSKSELRQSIYIISRAHFKYLEKPKDLTAFETEDKVQLSGDEARSGLWQLTIEEEED